MRQLKALLLVAACAVLCSCTHPEAAAISTTDVTIGTGTVAETGDTVLLSYTGTFKDGTVFDTNVPPANTLPTKPPFTFILTSGPNNGAIMGMNLGVHGMRVGGERKLTIPPELGYGDTEHPPIPANSVLNFDVKLVGVLKDGVQSDMTKTDKKVGTGPSAKRMDWVTITYTRDLLNGYPIDSSKSDGGQLQFQAGTGEIGDAKFVPSEGLIDGVVGMKVGGVRVLEMTSDLAFSNNSVGPPGVDTSLVRCTVTMLRISKTPIASKK